jgi:hypothetical protein
MQDSISDNIRTAQQRILILGATGGTGRLIVVQRYREDAMSPCLSVPPRKHVT